MTLHANAQYDLDDIDVAMPLNANDMDHTSEHTVGNQNTNRNGLSSYHIEMVDVKNIQQKIDTKNGVEDHTQLKADNTEDNKDYDSEGFDPLDCDEGLETDAVTRDSNIVARCNLWMRKQLKQVYRLVTKCTKGYFWSVAFVVGYFAYFIAAMCHRFGDEGSHRLMWATVVVTVFVLWPRFKQLAIGVAQSNYGSDSLQPQHKVLFRKVKRVVRWLLYVVMTGVMIYVLVVEGLNDSQNLQGLPGIFVFLLVAYLLSYRPSKVRWHSVFWSLALQFMCALFVLKWSKGRDIMIWLTERFNEFFNNSHAGSVVVFGRNWRDHGFIFGGLPTVFFTNAVFACLYYLGVMHRVIGFIGNILKFVIGVSPVEAMSVSMGIFMEGFVNLVMLKPFLESMTKSQMFSIIVGCMSSIGGAFLAMLASIQVPIEHIIPAMLVSAPATFAVSKLIMPEVIDLSQKAGKQKDIEKICMQEQRKHSNLVEAAQNGALSMLPACGNIAVILFTAFSLITWINHSLGWFGDRVGVDDFSIEWVSSYLLYPVAWLMGVEPHDCRRVGLLLGYRISIHNFVSFLMMRTMKANRLKYDEYMVATNFTGPVSEKDTHITLEAWNTTLTNGFLSDRSEAIATYCLTGFSAISSAAITMAVVVAIAPKRKRFATSITWSALLAANLANCMTGCFASLFY